MVEVTVAGDELLAVLNEKFRRRRGPTDVLAFSFGREDAEPEGFWLWGEVYVSADRAREQAAARRVPLDDELAALVAHGLLHLSGYGHGTPARRSGMDRAARAILRRG